MRPQRARQPFTRGRSDADMELNQEENVWRLAIDPNIKFLPWVMVRLLQTDHLDELLVPLPLLRLDFSPARTAALARRLAPQ